MASLQPEPRHLFIHLLKDFETCSKEYSSLFDFCKSFEYKICADGRNSLCHALDYLNDQSFHNHSDPRALCRQLHFQRLSAFHCSISWCLINFFISVLCGCLDQMCREALCSYSSMSICSNSHYSVLLKLGQFLLNWLFLLEPLIELSYLADWDYSWLEGCWRGLVWWPDMLHLKF